MDNEYDEPQLDEEQEAQQSGSESSQTHHQEEEEYGQVFFFPLCQASIHLPYMIT